MSVSLQLGREAAERVARANRADAARVAFPDADSFAPVRVRVGVQEGVVVRRGEERRRLEIKATAEAELAPPGADGLAAFAAGGGYDGPLAYRQGKPHRYATELDLGPPSAYGWLARNAERFHFIQRYEWEAWH